MIVRILYLLFWYLIISNNESVIDHIAKQPTMRHIIINELVKMQLYDIVECGELKHLGFAAKIAFNFNRYNKLEDQWYLGLYACPIYGTENSTAYFPLMQFNRRFREYCCDRVRLLGPTAGADLLEIIEESEYLYQIYDTLDDISRPNYKLFRRRAALGKLRVLLGDDAFERGTIPPHIPVDKFIRID